MIQSSCPAATALTAIGIQDCKQNLGQIQKMLVQRKFSTGVTRNSIAITAANEHLALATYTALLAAVDGTKMAATPFIQGVETTAGAKLTEGGGNASLDGIAVTVGRESSEFKGFFHSLQQKGIVENLKKLERELSLQVILINEFGQVIGETDSLTAPTYFRGIPIRAFFIGDLTLGGFSGEDKNEVSIMMPPNWSDCIGVFTLADGDARDLAL